MSEIYPVTVWFTLTGGGWCSRPPDGTVTASVSEAVRKVDVPLLSLGGLLSWRCMLQVR